MSGLADDVDAAGLEVDAAGLEVVAAGLDGAEVGEDGADVGEDGAEVGVCVGDAGGVEDEPVETGVDTEAVADDVSDAVNIKVTGEAPMSNCGTPTTGWPPVDALTTTVPAVLLVTATKHVPLSSVTHDGFTKLPEPDTIAKSACTPGIPV